MKLSFIPKCEEDFLSVLYVLAFDSAHKYYHHPFLLQKKKEKKRLGRCLGCGEVDRQGNGYNNVKMPWYICGRLLEPWREAMHFVAS